MNKTLLYLFLIIYPVLVLAQDHLEPGADFSSWARDYHKNVQSVLASAFAEGVELRIQVYPSFEPEWIVGLRREKDTFELFYTVPKQQVWGTEILKMYESGEITGDGSVDEDINKLKKEYPKGYRGIKVENQVYRLENEVAERIIAIFKSVIGDARVPDYPSAMMDGVIYVFEIKSDKGWVVAKTRSPHDGTFAAQCVDLAYSINSTVNGLQKLPAFMHDIELVEDVLTQRCQQNASLNADKSYE